MTQIHSFWLNLMMTATLNSAILNLAILHSAILVFFSNSLTFAKISSQNLHKINFTHSFWLNLMMAGILNSAMLDSDTAILDSNTLLSSLRFPQKHSSSTLNLNPTNSIWLTLWWQPSWILPSWILPFWIQPFCTKLWLKLVQSDSDSFILTQLDDGSHLEFCHHGFSHFAKKKKLHSFILTQLDDCSYLEICHPQFSHFVQKQLHSFILTQLDDGSHLEFFHLAFTHLSFFSQTHSHLPRLVPTICTKKLHSFILNHLDDCSYLEICQPQFSHFVKKTTSLIHSDSTWWWQPSSTLPSWIQPFCTKKTSLIHFDSTWWWQWSWILPCWIQTPCYLLSDSLKNTFPVLWLWLKLIQSD